MILICLLLQSPLYYTVISAVIGSLAAVVLLVHCCAWSLAVYLVAYTTTYVNSGSPVPWPHRYACLHMYTVSDKRGGHVLVMQPPLPPWLFLMRKIGHEGGGGWDLKNKVIPIVRNLDFMCGRVQQFWGMFSWPSPRFLDIPLNESLCQVPLHWNAVTHAARWDVGRCSVGPPPVFLDIPLTESLHQIPLPWNAVTHAARWDAGHIVHGELCPVPIQVLAVQSDGAGNAGQKPRRVYAKLLRWTHVLDLGQVLRVFLTKVPPEGWASGRPAIPQCLLQDLFNWLRLFKVEERCKEFPASWRPRGEDHVLSGPGGGHYAPYSNAVGSANPYGGRASQASPGPPSYKAVDGGLEGPLLSTCTGALKIHLYFVRQISRSLCSWFWSQKTWYLYRIFN